MEKFIPYEKLSKKKKRELDRKRRNTWGSLNPVTRNTANPKAYDRRKARKRDRDDLTTGPFALMVKGRLSVKRKAEHQMYCAGPKNMLPSRRSSPALRSVRNEGL